MSCGDLVRNPDWFVIDEVHIWGGADSVAANTEDLERASALQESAKSQLLSFKQELYGYQRVIQEQWQAIERATSVVMITGSSLPGNGIQLPTIDQIIAKNNIEQYLIDLDLKLDKLIEQCEELSVGVFNSAQVYSLAEQDSRSWWRIPAAGIEKLPLGLLGPVGIAHKTIAGAIAPEHATGAERMTGAAAAILTPFGTLPGNDNVSSAAQGLGPLMAWGHRQYLAANNIAQTQWDLKVGNLAEHKVSVPKITKIEDVVTAVVNNRAGHDGQVMIQQQVDSGGATSWVIFVPGTQEWDMNGQSHPIDLSGNMDLMSKENSLGMDYVRAAMEQAGIGPDDPVTFLGHSQGGILVNELQNDPLVMQKYNVTGVVTFCSPVARQTTNPRVKTLHVENTSDTVTHLDGRKNPDGINRVTVSANISGGGKAHSLEQNAAILASPTVRSDPSATAIISDIQEHMGTGTGGTIKTTFYEAKPIV